MHSKVIKAPVNLWSQQKTLTTESEHGSVAEADKLEESELKRMCRELKHSGRNAQKMSKKKISLSLLPPASKILVNL